jgi:hypothetical protein
MISHARVGTGKPQQRLRVDASFHQFRSPFWEGHGAVFAGRSASGRDGDRAGGDGQQVMPEIRENRKPRT